MCVLTLKVPIAPMGIPADLPNRLSSFNLDRYLVLSGKCTCQPRLQLPIAPMGFSHVLRVCLQGGGVMVWGDTVSFSSCTITGNTASGVRAHAQTSHRPDGIFTCLRSLVLAGRRCVHRRCEPRPCLCPEWLGELLIVHHHWQHSFNSACSRSNFPSPRWENC